MAKWIQFTDKDMKRYMVNSDHIVSLAIADPSTITLVTGKTYSVTPKTAYEIKEQLTPENGWEFATLSDVTDSELEELVNQDGWQIIWQHAIFEQYNHFNEATRRVFVRLKRAKRSRPSMIDLLDVLSQSSPFELVNEGGE